LLNLDEEEASQIIESSQAKAEELAEGVISFDGKDFSKEDTAAEPLAQSSDLLGEKIQKEKVDLFMKLGGVGEATASALAEAGYGTVGDIIADSVEEVALKSDLTIGIARTVQIAADKYLQENQIKDDSSSNR